MQRQKHNTCITTRAEQRRKQNKHAEKRTQQTQRINDTNTCIENKITNTWITTLQRSDNKQKQTNNNKNNENKQNKQKKQNKQTCRGNKTITSRNNSVGLLLVIYYVFVSFCKKTNPNRASDVDRKKQKL